MSAGLVDTMSDRAKQWIEAMRGKAMEVRQGVSATVTDLANEGFSTDGVWWNDEKGSTHLRLWLDVVRDLEENAQQGAAAAEYGGEVAP